jgi:hypothetical protein
LVASPVTTLPLHRFIDVPMPAMSHPFASCGAILLQQSSVPALVPYQGQDPIPSQAQNLIRHSCQLFTFPSLITIQWFNFNNGRILDL